MPVITFSKAQNLTTDAEQWANKLSGHIADPTAQAPQDIYPTQYLAFELDRGELDELLKSDAKKIVGILGYDTEEKTFCTIIVGLDGDYRPSANILPLETWPQLKGFNDLNDVVNGYLKV